MSRVLPLRVICVLSMAWLGSACAENEAAARSEDVVRIGVGLSGTARAVGLDVITDLLYAEPLLTREWDGRITPKTAESWAWQEGGNALTVRLRQGVSFHDGTVLTADVVARQFQPRIAAPDRPAAAGFQYVTSVSAPNPTTVVFQVTQPDLLLLAVLADIKIVHPSSPDLSTGPFRLLQKAPTVKAERFESYHGGRSGIERVEIVPYDTQRSAWAALLRGQIDAVQEIDREAVEFLAGNSRVKTYSSLQPFHLALVFNVRHPILKNVEVRRGIAESIDRDEIIARALRGRGLTATAPVWPLHWAYTEPSDPPPVDLRRARARLDKAGYPVRTPQSPNQPPSRFSIRCLVWGESALYERLALILQRQLSAVGVDLEIQLLQLDTIGPRVAAGDFDAYILPTNASRTLERMYRLWRSKSPENPRPLQDS